MTKSITLNYAVATLVAVALVLFSVAPAFADVNSSYIKISTKNSGHITNYTSSKADTGNNTAEGSYGGKGGSGGEIEANAETDGGGDAEATGNNGGAMGGTGGTGGTGGAGGLVETGKADSTSTAFNLLNTLLVKLSIL